MLFASGFFTKKESKFDLNPLDDSKLMRYDACVALDEQSRKLLTI